MSSNLYLFDPKQVPSNASEKSLIQVMREAEIARSQESARMFRNFVTGLSSLFTARKPARAANSVTEPAPATIKASHDEERLAA